MEPSEASWVSVEPGSVLVGSNNRSVLFGGVGPRHEVSIGYGFQISQHLLDLELANSLIESIGAEIASESEWELAYSRGLISGNAGTVEELADSFDNYWGKPCDGRPFIKKGTNPRILRIWRQNANAVPAASWDEGGGMGQPRNQYRLVIRDSMEWPEGPVSIPKSGNMTRILREEALISLFVGIIPSFVWAYFNASPGYISEGWLNLVFGGVFFGVMTIIFWRPIQPTWLKRDGAMVQDRSEY